jgi:hypothetical protein
MTLLQGLIAAANSILTLQRSRLFCYFNIRFFLHTCTHDLGPACACFFILKY